MSSPLAQRTRREARRVVAGVAGRLGYDLIARHFYSPIPALDQLPADIWTRRSELAGVDFDTAKGLEFVTRELGPLLADFRPPVASTGDPHDFFLDNGLYGSVDAETLHAMVRRFAPRRIVELGSGMSSLVIADACRVGDGPPTEHVVYDPFAREDLLPALRAVADVRPVSATEVPAAAFAALGEGDILFVDTTHTVRTGGDVNRIVLDVLPTLAPGVIVHIHDIYLPWEYPREFLAERNFFWAEQYLVQAFLAMNSGYEVLFSAHALWREHADAVRALGVDPRQTVVAPSAFWIRRVAGD